jgi:hypothetical protein
MEYVLGSLWFWLGAVAVVAILAGTTTSIIYGANETKRKLAEAANGGDYKKLADESAAVQRQVLARLDALDGRLATVEKTLTDIPG